MRSATARAANSSARRSSTATASGSSSRSTLSPRSAMSWAATVANGPPSTRTRTPPVPRVSGSSAVMITNLLLQHRLFLERAAGNGLHAELLFDLGLDLGEHRGVVLQEQLGVLPPLADALVVVGVPRARLLDDAGLRGDVHHQRGVA